MIADRRAKIVATIGPATASEEKLRELIKAGLNVARLNFSHGSYEDHLKVIGWIRALSVELKAPVTILQDLQGPKIRVGKFKDNSIVIKTGQIITVTIENVLGEDGIVPSDFPELISSVQPGDEILLDDGLMMIKVVEINTTSLKAEVINGGVLKNRKGMNIPGRTLQVDCMTPKDIEDLHFGLNQGVDVVALSFVRFGRDLRQLREMIKNHGGVQPKVCSKIEMKEAIENLDDIVSLSDFVMVARGDLAVEVGQSRLPHYQKTIIKTANRYNKPVITATQMLDSMVENPRPTRAEITDVANAVLDGTDALMLSAETASGKYPVECIRTMDEIIREVENSSSAIYHKLSLESEFLNDPSAISASASYSALKLDAKVIVCLTTSGKSVSLISGFRPKARIVAVTDQMEVLNRLEAVWGLQSLLVTPYQKMREVKAQVEQLLVEYGIARPGDKIVMTLGLPIEESAKTNSLHIWTLADRGYQRKDDSSVPLRFRKTISK